MVGSKITCRLTLGTLVILVMLICMQPSFAQDNNWPDSGTSHEALVVQSASDPVAGELLYSDNFTTRKESGWTTYSDENSTMFYKDGKYNIGVIRNAWSVWSFARKNISDYIVEVEATQQGGPEDNDYGLVTRYASKGNYSLFLISGDGFYSFAKRENNKWVVPVAWAKSSAINTGNATNLLKVVNQGENLTFYVNGVKLGDFVDSKPVSGDLGFWVETIVGGGVQVSFDNLKVWSIKE